MLLSAPKNGVILVLVRIWNCVKRGVCEVHSTARAAAVSPNHRATWDDEDDSHLVSSVFLIQRMLSGFGFVRNRHNDRCGLDSPSISPVPNHRATSVPSMPHLLETRFYYCICTYIRQILHITPRPWQANGNERAPRPLAHRPLILQHSARDKGSANTTR